MSSYRLAAIDTSGLEPGLDPARIDTAPLFMGLWAGRAGDLMSRTAEKASTTGIVIENE
jgi:hypothetical protein